MSSHIEHKSQEELAALFRAGMTSGVGRSVKHESCLLYTSITARHSGGKRASTIIPA